MLADKIKDIDPDDYRCVKNRTGSGSTLRKEDVERKYMD